MVRVQLDCPHLIGPLQAEWPTTVQRSLPVAMEAFSKHTIGPPQIWLSAMESH